MKVTRIEPQLPCGCGFIYTGQVLQFYGHHQASLVPACKNVAQHSFKNLTEQLSAQHCNITTEYVYENQSGLIKRQTIEKNLPTNAQVYFSGPAGFMSAVKNMLEKLGVPPDRQHHEFFGPAQTI